MHCRARTKQAKDAGSARNGVITGATEDAGMRRFAAGKARGTFRSDHYVSLPTALRIAARTSAACGMTNCSMTGANGSGQNFDPTRSIGASR